MVALVSNVMHFLTSCERIIYSQESQLEKLRVENEALISGMEKANKANQKAIEALKLSMKKGKFIFSSWEKLYSSIQCRIFDPNLTKQRNMQLIIARKWRTKTPRSKYWKNYLLWNLQIPFLSLLESWLGYIQRGLLFVIYLNTKVFLSDHTHLLLYPLSWGISGHTSRVISKFGIVSEHKTHEFEH